MPGRSSKPRQLQSRSVMTRQKLIDATIDQLWDKGYNGMTISAISARAGVTHGAHLHHFGTREELVAASVDALFQRSVAEYELRMADLPASQPARTNAALEQLRTMAMGRIFNVIGELLSAARTNPELAVQMRLYVASQRALQRKMYEWAFGEKLVQNQRFYEVLDATFAIYLRGLSTLQLTRTQAELDATWACWKSIAMPALLDCITAVEG